MKEKARVNCIYYTRGMQKKIAADAVEFFAVHAKKIQSHYLLALCHHHACMMWLFTSCV